VAYRLAAELVTSIRTVEGHVLQAARRTRVTTRAELVAVIVAHRQTGDESSRP
jgi:DNA-binding CsgD family transcriptional regulator